MTAWQDVLIGGSDQLESVVISATMDEAVIEYTLRDFVRPVSAWDYESDATGPEYDDGTAGRWPTVTGAPREAVPGFYDYHAQLAAQALQATVAKYGTRLSRTREQAYAAESREVEASNARQDARMRARTERAS